MGNRAKNLTKKFSIFWSSIPLQAKIFIVIASFFGIGFVFLSPPMKSPDEPQHYYRSFEVSEIDFRSTKYSDGRYGYDLPGNVGTFGEQSLIREEKHLPPDTSFIRSLNKQGYSKERRGIRFENSAVYSPVGYIFSATGIAVSRILHISVLKGYYLGRLFNLLAYILLVFLALCIVPAFRWIFMSIALLPMALFQAASFSPDAVTNGLACLAVALFFYLLKEKRIGIRLLVLTLAVLVPLSLTKQVYLLFLVPFLFIPKRKFSSTMQHIAWCLLVCGIPLAFSLVWLALSLDISSKLIVMFQLGNNVSATNQFKYILGHPLGYVILIFRTLFGEQSDYLLKGTLGLLGWATISLPLITYIAIALGLGSSVLVEGNDTGKQFTTKRVRYALVVTGLLVLVGVCTSLYLSFTPVGLNRIQGLQGRYFLPILFLILPFLVSKKFTLHYIKKNDFIIAHTILMCLILSSSLFVLAKETFFKSLM